MKAIWHNTVLAESDDTIRIENNHYFPEDRINKDYFKPGSTQTICPWKGVASYFRLEVDGEINENAAWFYRDPIEAAKPIKNRVAFWKGIKVVP